MQITVNMKTIKYTLAVVAAVLAFGSCEKHVITFDYESAKDLGKTAQFAVTYLEPIVVESKNAIHLVELNDVQLASTQGGSSLAVNGTLPGEGRFYVAKPGENTLKFYRISGEEKTLVYEKVINLEANKKTNLFVYSLSEDPVVLDNLYPYTVNPEKATLFNYATDSLATIRFYNFAFKGNASTPYPGKIQYQWCHDKSVGNTGRGGADGNWMNIGEAIGFGEATDRIPVVVWKETFVSAGSEVLWFRGVDTETGEVVIAVDWWTTAIGSVVNHVYRGVSGGTPKAGVTVYRNL